MLVAEALLAYRPQSVPMLDYAVSMLRKAQIKERYMGDLLWLTAKAQYKRFDFPPYSDSADRLEGKTPEKQPSAECTIRSILEPFL